MNVMSRIFRVEHYRYENEGEENEKRIIVNRVRYELMYLLAYLIGLIILIAVAIGCIFLWYYLKK